MRNSSSRRAGLTDDRFDQLKTTLEDGIDLITSGEDWKRYLEFQARFYRYSFTNMMLVLMQRPDATMVQARGERKDGKVSGWKALGRTVIEGREESGKIFVWAPRPRTVEDKSAKDGKRTFTSFYPVPVFDVSDTEGDPVPEGATVRLLEGDDAKGLLKLVLEFITANKWTYEFVPVIPGSEANGDCSPTECKIRICTEGRDLKQQAKTAIHEAAHMLLHSGGKGISVPREQKEVEAESVAFIVSAHLGVDTGDYSFGYVAGWAAATGFTHRTVLKHSGKRIQSAAKKIILAIEGDGAEEDAE
jgi:hypothetical protein